MKANKMDFKDKKNILAYLNFQREVYKNAYSYIRKLTQNNYKQAVNLTYWINSYFNFLRKEKYFQPRMNMNYKRGQIVYINFGYRIGSEIGGAHYAIVLDTKSSKDNSTITVVPLKSKRDKETKYSKIYHYDLNDTFSRLVTKKATDILAAQTSRLDEIVAKAAANPNDNSLLSKLQEDQEDAKQQAKNASEILSFDKRLSHKSVADIGQITTISKQRIIHPIKNKDILFNICVSKDIMEDLSKRIIKLYISD